MLFFDWVIVIFFFLSEIVHSEFVALLQIVEIATLFGWKFLVGAIFDDLSLVKDHDSVTLLDCTHSVSNDDRCTSFHGSIESLLNDFLTALIKSWSSFVQNQDLWILYQSSCDSDTLLLTTWKLRSTKAADLLESRVQRLLHSIHFPLINKSLKLLFV